MSFSLTGGLDVMPLPWPPHSPGITPLNFLLRGFVKDKIHITKVNFVVDLIAQILQLQFHQ